MGKDTVIKAYTVGVENGSYNNIILYTNDANEAVREFSNHLGWQGINAKLNDKFYIQVSNVEVGTYLNVNHDNISYGDAISIARSYNFSLADIFSWKDEYIDFYQDKYINILRELFIKYSVYLIWIDLETASNAIKEFLEKIPLKELKRFDSGQDTVFNSYIKSINNEYSRKIKIEFIKFLIQESQ